MDYYVVEAFTQGEFGGNTAGVVIYNKLDKITMQSMAAKLSFSETAFVKRLSHELFEITYFTPNSEIGLCGHATIASFNILLDIGLVEKNRSYKIETLTGTLSVYVDNDLIYMEAGTPMLDSVLDKHCVEKLCSVMGINSSELGAQGFDLNPQIVSTGLKDIMLPVKSVDVLNRIKPCFTCLAEFTKELGIVGVHAFTLDSNESTARCRNFAPLYGIDEESATGTSNASLTYYLFKNNVIKDINNTYVFSQGESIGKPSKIYTKFSKEDEKILVGGKTKIKKLASF